MDLDTLVKLYFMLLSCVKNLVGTLTPSTSVLHRERLNGHRFSRSSAPHDSSYISHIGRFSKSCVHLGFSGGSRTRTSLETWTAPRHIFVYPQHNKPSWRFASCCKSTSVSPNCKQQQPENKCSIFGRSGQSVLSRSRPVACWLKSNNNRSAWHLLAAFALLLYSASPSVTARLPRSAGRTTGTLENPPKSLNTPLLGAHWHIYSPLFFN